jgi:hypothetical protein
MKTLVGLLALIFAAQLHDTFEVASLKPAGEASVEGVMAISFQADLRGLNPTDLRFRP